MGGSEILYTLLRGRNATGYEDIIVSDTVIGLTPDEYGDATKAEMTLETAEISVRKDGSDPTPTKGHLVKISDTITLKSAADIASFKAIKTGAVSGVLKITYSE